MKKSQLKEMISKLVSEELKVQLPNFLSEMYLKKIVKENTTRNVGSVHSLAELDSYDEEEETEYDERIPEPMENSDDSIYKKNPFSNNNEVAQKLLSKSNPLHEIYENMEFSEPDTGVEIDNLKFGDFFNKMMDVSGNKSPIKQVNTVEENRLNEYRKSLEKHI